jgi:hypothetical protein
VTSDHGDTPHLHFFELRSNPGRGLLERPTSGDVGGAVGRVRRVRSRAHRAVACALAAGVVMAGAAVPAPASASQAGPGIAVGTPDPPDRPTLGFANAAILVSFTAPADNGAPIRGYTASCASIDGGGAGSIFAVRSPIKVGGLTVGRTYRCRVSATNDRGTGAPSPGSDALVVVGVPATPATPAITRGVGVIIVRFTPPFNHGAAITTFTAKCSSSNLGIRGANSGPRSPITVSGLTNGKIYACTVSATNAVGTSLPSSFSQPVVTGTAPAAPTVTGVVPGPAPGATGPLIVSLRAGSNRGTPISSYRISCTSIAGGDAGANSSTGSPITIPALVAGDDYACRGVAMSASGTSSPSNALTATVGAPGPPQSVQIARQGHGVRLSFERPGSNGSAILRFHARCTSTDGGAANDQYAHTTKFSVSGLTPGKRYTCTLTAVNARGASPAALTSAVRIPF